MAGKQMFISKSSFAKKVNKKKEEKRDIINWPDLPVDGVIYKIIDVKKIDTKFGVGTVLNIIDKFGTEKKVWALSRLSREIETETQSSNPRDIYFTTLGQVIKDGKKYNNYESVYQ